MKTRSRTARSVPLGRGVRGGTGMPCAFPIRAYHHTASPRPPAAAGVIPRASQRRRVVCLVCGQNRWLPPLPAAWHCGR